MQAKLKVPGRMILGILGACMLGSYWRAQESGVHESVLQPAKEPHVERGYAPVNDLRLYYEVWGEEGGVPLLLIHGGGSTIETSFGKFLMPLSEERRVVAFDQQGHGRTADVDRPFTFEQSADDAAALLRDLGIERADVLGYSNGGNIAMQLAIRHPTLVRKLVVASAMVRRDGLADAFWESMPRATLADMPAELKDAYLQVAPDPGQLQAMHDKCVARMLAFRDWPDEVVASIEAPTLVMVGDADIVRPEHAVEMFRLIPDAELGVLPGTDHMEFVRAVDWQVSMIEGFLDAPPPTRHPRDR